MPDSNLEKPQAREGLTSDPDAKKDSESIGEWLLGVVLLLEPAPRVSEQRMLEYSERPLWPLSRVGFIVISLESFQTSYSVSDDENVLCL